MALSVMMSARSPVCSPLLVVAPDVFNLPLGVREFGIAPDREGEVLLVPLGALGAELGDTLLKL
jgi:hypothetical protein